MGIVSDFAQGKADPEGATIKDYVCATQLDNSTQC